jgi:hypothetical protein
MDKCEDCTIALATPGTCTERIAFSLLISDVKAEQTAGLSGKMAAGGSAARSVVRHLDAWTVQEGKCTVMPMKLPQDPDFGNGTAIY